MASFSTRLHPHRNRLQVSIPEKLAAAAAAAAALHVIIATTHGHLIGDAESELLRHREATHHPGGDRVRCFRRKLNAPILVAVCVCRRVCACVCVCVAEGYVRMKEQRKRILI